MGTRNVIRTQGERPLFVLAGFPDQVANRLRAQLSKAGDLKASDYIAFASPNGDNDCMYSRKTVHGLLSAVGGFAFKERHKSLKKKCLSAPTRIFLLFIAGSGWQQLLCGFGFSVYPLWLKTDLENDGSFSHKADEENPITQTGDRIAWRHDNGRALKIVKAAVRYLNDGSDSTRFLAKEILERRGKSPLLLPPRNFNFPGRRSSLAKEFAALRSRNSKWPELLDKVKPKKFVYKDLPKVLGAQGKSKAYYFTDSRELVFPPDEQAHGLPRELPSNPSPRDIQLLLNQMYRFGMPIEGGFHHDAQRVGQHLNNEQFDCSCAGVVSVSASHANVYPNDYVRWTA